jgi:multicomponent K+:H+ antiporter subunit G
MNELPLLIDLLLSALVVLGGVFALIGAWGLAKFRDFLKRLHGPTKASTVGVGAVLLASMGYFATVGRPSAHELLITLFVFLTAPVAAHLLVKAAMHLDARLRPPAGPPHDEVDAAGR